MERKDANKVVEELQEMRRLDDEKFAIKVRKVLCEYERLKREEKLKNALGHM
ncbi:hypothetical protein P4V41_07445 [Fictibacillus nanhaiensis]|uniref:hypothetical protein n=1 Tax=Fictibacillus nanhaiensis TaxID=742169 RepID=UPI002E24E4B3|nr:hypothetical protein [Fictibacillus nanhaiensis]